jgi:hypothetical protein
MILFLEHWIIGYIPFANKGLLNKVEVKIHQLAGKSASETYGN